jgi:hypothetical protein
MQSGIERYSTPEHICSQAARRDTSRQHQTGEIAMRDKNMFPTRTQMQRLVKSGRSALERRLLRAVVLPLDRQSSEAEVKEIKALLLRYNEVMSVYEKPKASSAVEPSTNENDNKGGIGGEHN